MKQFNVTGLCVPEYDYMVDLTGKIEQIMKLVDNKNYFTINRGRQYGKTTMLLALKRKLHHDFKVASISFEGIGDEDFASVTAFCQMFLKEIQKAFRNSNNDYGKRWLNKEVLSFADLDDHIALLCKDEKVILMIDEVDKISSNRIFLNFLGLLRDKYLNSKAGEDFTFHSVILAGVYDVKNIKRYMVQLGLESTIGKMNNSPWNIAVDFEVRMSFDPKEIATMLHQYEADHHTGMDIALIAEEIHRFTGGYPVLVCRICKKIHEKLNKDWTIDGMRQAVHLILQLDIPLFQSLWGNLEDYDDVYALMYDLVILGKSRSFSLGVPAISLAYRYRYIKNYNGRARVSSRIFELVMTDYFIGKDETKTSISSSGFIPIATAGGRLNLPLLLERFKLHWQEVYTKKEKHRSFYEAHYRIIFLSFLKPFLNGVGFYEIESQTTDDSRMDLIVIYGSDKFIIELKKWKGPLYNAQGVQQLLGYLKKAEQDKGYLLTFDFRQQKIPFESCWTAYEEKQIFEVRV